MRPLLRIGPKSKLRGKQTIAHPSRIHTKSYTGRMGTKMSHLSLSNLPKKRITLSPDRKSLSPFSNGLLVIYEVAMKTGMPWQQNLAPSKNVRVVLSV